jgi:hypothetical protein
LDVPGGGFCVWCCGYGERVSSIFPSTSLLRAPSLASSQLCHMRGAHVVICVSFLAPFFMFSSLLFFLLLCEQVTDFTFAPTVKGVDCKSLWVLYLISLCSIGAFFVLFSWGDVVSTPPHPFPPPHPPHAHTRTLFHPFPFSPLAF